jgi:MFS family permease
VAGLLLVAAGLAVLAQLGTHSSYLLIVAGLVPLGAGMGLAMPPATTAITDALPKAQQGVGSALNDLSRELGGAFGIAVIGTILTSTYRAHLHLPGVPTALVDRARDSFGVAVHLGHPVTRHAQSAFTAGLHTALLAAAAAALVGVLVTAVLLAGTGRHSTEPAD